MTLTPEMLRLGLHMTVHLDYVLGKNTWNAQYRHGELPHTIVIMVTSLKDIHAEIRNELSQIAWDCLPVGISIKWEFENA